MFYGVVFFYRDLCAPRRFACMVQAWQRYKASVDDQDDTYDSTTGARWGEDKHRDVQAPAKEDADMRDIEDNDHAKVGCLLALGWLIPWWAGWLVFTFTSFFCWLNCTLVHY